MKRIFCMMLVAMLLVGCMSIAAFATESTKAATFTVTVSGAEFSSFGGWVSVSEPATITAISGVTGNKNTGKVGYANGNNENVSSVGITVTVSVPANYCGTISASFKMDEAYKVIKNEDGSVAKHEAVTVSGSGATTFAHAWGEWTTTAGDCKHEGVKTRTCSNCGATETAGTGLGAHSWKEAWEKNASGHWHVCSLCGTASTTEAHTWKVQANDGWETVKPSTEEEEGLKQRVCSVCSYKETDTIPASGEPDMGDITGQVTMGATAVLLLVVASVAFVFKRKTAK
ncbi:MAG: hypothetical protein IJ422_03990 [Oscillospiraceae bacterium]|nr:hypothetical protein [Oscillospiraceae bacterium]